MSPINSSSNNSKRANKAEKKDSGIPLGLGMALAQNDAAMERFSSLSEGQRNIVLASASMVNSKREMQLLVQNLSEGKVPEGENLMM